LELILPSIRFPLLSGKFLVKKVEQNKTLANVPILKDLLFETYRYKACSEMIPKRLSAKSRKGNALFDAENLHNCIDLSDDGKTVNLKTFNGSGWASQNIIPQLADEDKYIELKVNQCGGSGMFFGVATIVQNGVNCGSTVNSVGWQSTGYVYTHSGGANQSLPAWTTGSKIGILFSVKDGYRKLNFFLNGKNVGSHQGIPSNVKAYAQISVYTQGDSFTINSTMSPDATDNTEEKLTKNDTRKKKKKKDASRFS